MVVVMVVADHAFYQRAQDLIRIVSVLIVSGRRNELLKVLVLLCEPAFEEFVEAFVICGGGGHVCGEEAAGF